MNIAGIDYSYTSPAITIHDTELDWNFENCRIFYLTQTNKYAVTTKNIQGDKFKKYADLTEHYDNISMWSMSIISQFEVSDVFLEGYAYLATGRVFDIGENTGILKHKLRKNNVKVTTVPPTVIKKMASGKGTANKEGMEESFIEQTGINLRAVMKLPPSLKSPLSDIIDSYYICKYGYHEQ